MPRVIVDPDDKVNQTHHISLNDGTNTIGLIACNSKGDADGLSITSTPLERTAVKTSSGNTAYSDMESPWSAIAQIDWSGGRGLLNFTEDTTRYYDGFRANTTIEKKIFLGGQESYATGYRSMVQNVPGSVTWKGLKTGVNKYIAYKFTPTANFTMATFAILVRRFGTPTVGLTVELRSDTYGSPGAVVATDTIAITEITDTLSQWVTAAISSALVAGTYYWIVVYPTSAVTDNYYEVAVNAVVGATKNSSDGTTWLTSTYDLYFRCTDAEVETSVIFFDYKRAKYAVINNETAFTAAIWMNGDRGVADSNAGNLDKIYDTSKTWTVNEWAGCVVMITAGPGFVEKVNYRVIVSNTATHLVVSPNWVLTQNTNTEYVILGSNKWKKVVDTAYTTDVCVTGEYAFICHGDVADAYRFREYNNAGTFTTSHADEEVIANKMKMVLKPETTTVIERTVSTTTHAADVLKTYVITTTSHGFVDGDLVFINAMTGAKPPNGVWMIKYHDATSFLLVGADGSWNGTGGTCIICHGNEVWRANNIDSSSKISVSRSFSFILPVSVLSFASPVTFDDGLGRITNLIMYGDSANYLHVMREDSVWVVAGIAAEELKIQEMHSVGQDTNGQAALTHGIYLWFNFGGGAERYYNGTMDDKGPNRDEGLPDDRKGVITSMAGYPGQIIVGMDAGDGSSSVLISNGGEGWHELYRHTLANKSITAISIQVVPGTNIDKLWIAAGYDIVCVPLPSGTFNPTKDTNYTYTHESAITSCWITANMVDIYKLFNTLKVFSESLVKDEQFVIAEYQVDDETTWTKIEDEFDESPSQEIAFKETLGLNGKRLRIRLRLQTTDNTKTPIVTGTVIEAISRIVIKHAYSMSYRVRDGDVNLKGELEDITAEDKQEIIEDWITNTKPLTMRCVYAKFDNKTVFINPPEEKPLEEQKESYLNKITLVEM